MSEQAIYNDFAELVETFAAGLSPAPQVDFPGIKFSPPQEGTWLEVTWIPNQPTNYGLANDGPRLLQGLAQISICFRPGKGIMDELALADLIITAFDKGTTFGGVRVPQRPALTGPVESPERVALPITIPWQGFNA